MSLSTFSVFYTSIKVDSTNNYINFNEGGGELSATIDAGRYSLTEILTVIKTAMDAIGGQEYTVTLDRDTRKITISATSNFDLLIDTGSQSGIAIWSDIGFTGGVDLTGSNSYEGSQGGASEYQPQFILQDYVESQNYKEKISPTVNESASGRIEVVSFGTRQFFEMSFKFITDKSMDGHVIKNNPSGVSDFRAFMDNAIEKGNLEFMPDVNDRGNFYKVLLETAPGNNKGTGYKLSELLGQGLPGFYELNKVKFRVV